jgi:hypothetical protein
VRRRAIRLLPIVAAARVAAATPCVAQTDLRLDAAMAYVKYDGYIGSGAAVVSPAVAWHSPRTNVAARGTFLLFETGHTSLDGLLSASTFSPPLGPLRVEGAAEAGGSAYSGYSGTARFAHALGDLRVHLIGGRWGLFAGALAGGLSSPDANGSASGVSAGLWARGPASALEITWTHVAVLHMDYGDLQGRARWQTGPVAIEANAGTRAASAGIGAGAYGDLSATLRVSERVDVVVAAGSYPSDPVRGTIPGRYLTAGVRLATGALARRAEPLAVAAPPPPSPSAASPWLAGARVAIEQLGGRPALVVYADNDHRVELSGDFTDWQPVALASDGPGRYRLAAPLTAGMWRFNVRLDGGPWGVPQGAALEADEFGGSVGVLVVP